MTQEPCASYVLGHSAAELARLERQAGLFDRQTRALLIRAGVRAGQRVLDLGCGVGDVSFAAADLVGPSGQVIGVDRAAGAVATARQRAAARGLAQVSFVESALDALDIPPVDAVVGRFVLMHQPDPAQTLARAARLLGPGGLVAIMESHLTVLTSAWHSWPPSPAYSELLNVMLRMIEAAGGRTDMGLGLRATFLDAGLPDPVLDVQATLSGADAPWMCRYMADSLRSMQEVAAQLGVESLTAEAIDALERRMLDDVSTPGAVMNGPVVVTAWCAVP
jgi:SAM-dependent methyltransferase